MSEHSEAQPRDPGLEERLQRLENTLAKLPDLQELEEKVVERVSRRLPPPAPAPAGNIIEAGSRILGTSHPLLVPGAVAASGHGREEHASPFQWSRPVFMLDLIAEARSFVRMYVDPRYNIGWLARLVPIVLLLAIFTSQIWIPGIHFMPDWLAIVVSKVVDLLLAYVLYKILSREARRYRETAPDLPASLRL